MVGTGNVEANKLQAVLLCEAPRLAQGGIWWASCQSREDRSSLGACPGEDTQSGPGVRESFPEGVTSTLEKWGGGACESLQGTFLHLPVCPFSHSFIQQLLLESLLCVGGCRYRLV